MQSQEIRKRFLTFFEKRGHTIVSSASLIPTDQSVLFTTAGMQQFKPYYVGKADAQKDFGSLNTVSIQKCVRTSDIDEVGDESHLTFFEMLGNFSFGGYFKKKAIRDAYDFITQEMGLTIDYVSVFRGTMLGRLTSGWLGVPKDKESIKIWRSIDPKIKIIKGNKEDNFWGPTGVEGPCGPTTEIYINGVEIWNIVFNEYYHEKDGTLKNLKTPGIDTGMGLERLTVAAQGVKNVFETDLFSPIIQYIKETTTSDDERGTHIVADHMRSAIFMIVDGVEPSNSGRGYVLRRLIRRARYFYSSLGAHDKALGMFVYKILPIFKEAGYGLGGREESIDLAVTSEETDFIVESIRSEEKKFSSTLEPGKKLMEKIIKKERKISGKNAFLLHATYGYTLELQIEIANENNVPIDVEGFWREFEKHQNISRTGSEQKFKGGLADASPEVVKLHTATHLLNAALKKVLGSQVKQRGSNITKERLRFDFSYPEKLTDKQKHAIENLINDWISRSIPVIRNEMSKEKAEKLGAEMEFGAKYPDTVSVYTIMDGDEVISREFCGGPHVTNTKDIEHITIVKEESVAAGVRRIKAILQ